METVGLDLLSADEALASLKRRGSKMLSSKKALRVAVAAKSDTLRPVVIEQITHECARTNAKRAAIDSLPGILPSLDFLLPFTGAGDMFVLTRNQLGMVLEIAACHNLAPDPKERFTELLPVIGSAFGWRALARELLAFAPFGTGVVITAAVAYAGTYTVGRAVDYYYASGGKSLDLTATFRSVSEEAVKRASTLLKRVPTLIGTQKTGTAGV